MSIPRLFQPVSLYEGETIALSLEAVHYLNQVRRIREGDPVILFNGQGGEFTAHIVTIRKGSSTVKIEAYQAIDRESPLTIHLAQGIARGEKMDFIVQKAVELGVKKIIPLLTERSTVRLEADKCSKRQQHWQAVAVSACEQSGRNKVPDVLLPLSFAEWATSIQEKGILLSPTSNTKISQLDLKSTSIITLLIGPEGGLSEPEIAALLRKDWVSLNIGPRILRTETAPLAVIAALQAQFGDMG